MFVCAGKSVMCVDVNSGCSDVDRQAGVYLSAQFDSVTGDGRQHWLWHQQVMQYS